MELIVLKMPPERVALLASVLQDYIEDRPNYPEIAELTHILVWLRYRHGKWLAAQSVAQVSNQEPPRTDNR